VNADVKCECESIVDTYSHSNTNSNRVKCGCALLWTDTDHIHISHHIDVHVDVNVVIGDGFFAYSYDINVECAYECAHWRRYLRQKSSLNKILAGTFSFLKLHIKNNNKISVYTLFNPYTPAGYQTRGRKFGSRCRQSARRLNPT